MGKREVRQIRTAVVRLAGHSAGAPSGDAVQSNSRIRTAIWLVPGKTARWPDSSPTLITLPVAAARGEPTRAGPAPPSTRAGARSSARVVGAPRPRDRGAVFAGHRRAGGGEAVVEPQAATNGLRGRGAPGSVVGD